MRDFSPNAMKSECDLSVGILYLRITRTRVEIFKVYGTQTVNLPFSHRP